MESKSQEIHLRADMLENSDEAHKNVLGGHSSRLYTYGQLAESQTVTGKPSTTTIAMETLQVTPSRVGEFREPTQQEAEAVMKEWREAWRVFVVWLFTTAVFTMFYVIYLKGLYLALAVGVVFTVITSAMYFSPWFKTADRLFVLMAFMVGTFMSDFICAFLSIVFGFNEPTVLGCGALIFVHGTLTLYFFRKYNGVVAAATKLEAVGNPSTASVTDYHQSQMML